MARRPHPYFGRINRLEGARVAPAGKSAGHAPKMTPDEQQGVLWQAIREDSDPA